MTSEYQSAYNFEFLLLAGINWMAQNVFRTYTQYRITNLSQSNQFFLIYQLEFG